MKDDSNEILSGLICDWHRWALGYKHVGGINSSPMFREVRHGRAWDTLDEIIDSDIENGRMDALDHIIMGMSPVHRTAIQLQARNLHTGRSVWTSARLPPDLTKRIQILCEARAALMVKLQDAGVL